jgi:hypothetical protein
MWVQIPPRPFKLIYVKSQNLCGGMVDAEDLKSSVIDIMCGFKSHHRYSASLMVEHVTVNHMMRVRFPRGTWLSSISGIVVVCKTIGVGSSPTSAWE